MDAIDDHMLYMFMIEIVLSGPFIPTKKVSTAENPEVISAFPFHNNLIGTFTHGM